jgi:hypothetical protein
MALPGGTGQIKRIALSGRAECILICNPTTVTTVRTSNFIYQIEINIYMAAV